jgi:hypothetical protein
MLLELCPDSAQRFRADVQVELFPITPAQPMAEKVEVLLSGIELLRLLRVKLETEPIEDSLEPASLSIRRAWR